MELSRSCGWVGIYFVNLVSTTALIYSPIYISKHHRHTKKWHWEKLKNATTSLSISVIRRTIYKRTVSDIMILWGPFGIILFGLGLVFALYGDNRQNGTCTYIKKENKEKSAVTVVFILYLWVSFFFSVVETSSLRREQLGTKCRWLPLGWKPTPFAL